MRLVPGATGMVKSMGPAVFLLAHVRQVHAPTRCRGLGDKSQRANYRKARQPHVFELQRKLRDAFDPNDVADSMYRTLAADPDSTDAAHDHGQPKADAITLCVKWMGMDMGECPTDVSPRSRSAISVI